MSENKNKKQTQTLLECDKDDVICVDGRLYKIAELKNSVKSCCSQIRSYLSNQRIKISGDTDEERHMNLWRGTDTADFEILHFAGGCWKKCKLKIHLLLELEICNDEEEPEKSESPLDDIRRSLSENGS